MVCLRIRGQKGRSNRGPTTTLQQGHWPSDTAKVDQNGPAISSSVVKTETTTGTDKRKFLCSYGGKILPQPSDRQLKYVGGETRVVCVPRSISYSDLNKKIEDLFKVGEIVIKYRTMSEDLDTLVSVRCNDDLVYLWEEYDQLMSLGSLGTSPPRFFRLFIFCSSKSLSSSRPRHYVDAINYHQIDATSVCHPEPSRDYHHTEFVSLCHTDDPTAQTNCVALRPEPNRFHRVWSTPNLCGAHQTGNHGLGPSGWTQNDHVYRNHVQLNGHSHHQACGWSDTFQCGNISAYSLTKVERSPVRVSSYQNLNLACQAGSAVSDRSRSNQVQSPRTIGASMQNPIPYNQVHSNILQSPRTNTIDLHKPIHNGGCVHNSTPHSSSEQNLIQSYSGAFGSVGPMVSMHAPLEVGSSIYVQQPRSGSITPVGSHSRTGAPVSEGF